MPSKCGKERRRRQRERERQSACVGATASCCCWSSRSPFDVMQSALTKCQRQAKEPKPKASPDLTACLPCAFKISLATGLGLIVCVLFMLPFSFLFPLFHFDFFFFVGTLKSRRCQANRQCPSVTFCGDRAEARAI